MFDVLNWTGIRQPESPSSTDEDEVVLGDIAEEIQFSGPNFDHVSVRDNDQDVEEDFLQVRKTVSDVSQVQFKPYLRQLQRIVVYETKSRLYIIGSNVSSSQFHILKVDRTEPKDLVITEEANCHTQKEIIDILKMVDSGNSSKVGQKIGSGLTKKLSAFGIVGFVRFLEGYYIIFVTKRRKAAMIGPHCIYKIEDVELKYIPNDDVRQTHADESRYLKMFSAFDLSSNFYFSYSYDLTNCLQHNMAMPKKVRTKDGHWLDIKDVFPEGQIPSELSYVSEPNWRYMWNEYLVNPVRDGRIKYDWILPIIHGFVDQANISIHGRPILLTLIARRSNRFAGTRFLKRGSNFQGDVANEVETEQIVGDSSISELSLADFTSFVQIRGSVPGHWSQDISKMVPKPQIFYELTDPYGRTSGNHFDYLLKKYGSPIVILNLVKTKERRRRHECLLSEEFQKQIEYLNRFLRRRDQIRYIHLDMARCKKRKDGEVLSTLADIASHAVKRTGIFRTRSRPTCLPKSLEKNPLKQKTSGNMILQTGVVRTNCVDCLDRTNTAQFVVSKCALAHQLHAMGFLAKPELDFNSDCARILESMFEDHGDTLALQYGGSQLIHRIKSYRKESEWTSKANDIAQTVRRYYSNTLSDTEKQATMNLFLGVFRPQYGKPAIWEKEITSDHYLHLPALRNPFNEWSVLAQIGTHWWNPGLRLVLPRPMNESDKRCLHLIAFDVSGAGRNFEFEDFYRPREIQVMSDLFQFKEVVHSVRDYMPNCCTDFSPFVVRDRETRRREEAASFSRKSTSQSIVKMITSAFSFGSKTSSASSIHGSQSTPTISDIASSSAASSSKSVTEKKNPSVNAAGARNTSQVSSDEDDEDDDDEDGSSSESFEWLGETNSETSIANDVHAPLTFDGMFSSTDDVELTKWESQISHRDIELLQSYATLSLLSVCETSLEKAVFTRELLPLEDNTSTCNDEILEKYISQDDLETTLTVTKEDKAFYEAVAGLKTNVPAFYTAVAL